jgi:Icc-related predicted phosphoesterase
VQVAPEPATLWLMKLVITSDLHQRMAKWNHLLPVVKAERPRFVLIAGDLLPKAGFQEQKAFFGEMRRLFHDLKQFGPVTVLTYLGNDDAHILEPLLDQLQAEGLCINLNGRIHREEGLVFCGMSKVRDYPFGYKHWCVPDGDYVACPEQFCGEGVTLDERGHYVPLANLVAYLSSKPSIGDELDRLKAQLRAGEMERSVWMIHQPPTGLGMDLIADGRPVGSATILTFIENNQPLLGCSGHIHESPYQPGGKWAARVGRTLWMQPGQMEQRLHYVSLEIGDAFVATNIRHSIFGPDDS